MSESMLTDTLWEILPAGDPLYRNHLQCIYVEIMETHDKLPTLLVIANTLNQRYVVFNIKSVVTKHKFK